MLLILNNKDFVSIAYFECGVLLIAYVYCASIIRVVTLRLRSVIAHI